MYKMMFSLFGFSTVVIAWYKYSLDLYEKVSAILVKSLPLFLVIRDPVYLKERNSLKECIFIIQHSKIHSYRLLFRRS